MLCSLVGFMELKFHWKWEISFYGVDSAYGGGFLCFMMLADMLALSASRT